MAVTSATNPVFHNREGTAIFCDVTLSDHDGTFGYVACDGDATSQRLFDDLKAGHYGSVAAYAAPAVAPPSLATLVTQATAAVSAAGGSVVAQVFPDAVRQAAFQNAASILNGNGGAAPTTEPLASAFAALAAAYGMSASAFANVVLTAQTASLSLSTAQTHFAAAAEAAANPSALATAINEFETALAAVVASLNGAFPVDIVAPDAIAIAGVNA